MESWRRKVVFDMLTLRDQRLRHCYAKRFDYKVNVMDWNYQMNLTPSASIIHWKQYKSFALTGVAFERRLADQAEPNRTLSAYTPATDTRRHQNVKVRGFWGDIVNGPFYAYGVTTCEPYHERLFRKVNLQHRYNTQEIADFNLIRLLYMLEEGKELTLPPSSKEDDLYPLPSPAELLFRKSPSSSRCQSSAADRVEASGADQRRTAREAAPAPAAENTSNNVEDGTDTPTQPSDDAKRNSSESTDGSTDAKIDCDEPGEATSAGLRNTEATQQACLTAEKVPTENHGNNGNPASALAAPVLEVSGVLNGLRSARITLLKGDASEVLRRRKYAGLFDMVVAANTAAGTILKDCNLLDPAQGERSAGPQTTAPEESVTSSSDDNVEPSVNNSAGETIQPSPESVKEAARVSPEAVDALATRDGETSDYSKTYLSECLAENALICVETFKYSAALDPIAKLRFRKLVARCARGLRWTLCNADSLPSMASEMMEHEDEDRRDKDTKKDRVYSSNAAARQEAAADAYMIYSVGPVSCPPAAAPSAGEV